jgi:prevent-host-death family protein
MVTKYDQSLELTTPNMQTISASEFKARCLELLDRLADRTLERVTITRRGRVVGVLLPPESHADPVRRVHGFMRGSVTIPPGIDLTEPASLDLFTAEEGTFHG